MRTRESWHIASPVPSQAPSHGNIYPLDQSKAVTRSTTSYPLIVSLHGAGEIGDGDDPEGVLSEGSTGMLPSLFRDEKVPPNIRNSVVLVAPRAHSGWSNSEIQTFVQGLISALARPPGAATTRKFHIDRDRLYLTGCSMGGAATWEAGTATGLFSALLPVCAASSGPTREEIETVFKEKRIAVWAFHGVNDVVVPVATTDSAMRKFREAGYSKIKYSRFEQSPTPPGWPMYIGHASWIPAYQEPGLWEWLLNQRFVPR